MVITKENQSCLGRCVKRLKGKGEPTRAGSGKKRFVANLTASKKSVQVPIDGERPEMHKETYPKSTGVPESFQRRGYNGENMDIERNDPSIQKSLGKKIQR